MRLRDPWSTASDTAVRAVADAAMARATGSGVGTGVGVGVGVGDGVGDGLGVGVGVGVGVAVGAGMDGLLPVGPPAPRWPTTEAISHAAARTTSSASTATSPIRRLGGPAVAPPAGTTTERTVGASPSMSDPTPATLALGGIRRAGPAGRLARSAPPRPAPSWAADGRSAGDLASAAAMGSSYAVPSSGATRETGGGATRLAATISARLAAGRGRLPVSPR